VSKLTPVNKALFQDSATKPKRPTKSKLPPVSGGGVIQTVNTGKSMYTIIPLCNFHLGKSIPEVVVISDENSREEVVNAVVHPETNLQLQESTCESVTNIHSIPSAAEDLSVESATDAIACRGESPADAAQEGTNGKAPAKSKSKPRAPRAKKTATGTKTQKKGAAKKKSDNSDEVAEEAQEGKKSLVDIEQEVSDPTNKAPSSLEIAIEDGTSGESEALVAMGEECEEPAPAPAPVVRKRKRTAKAAAASQESDGMQQEELSAAEVPLPSDVLLRLETLKSRKQGVLDALQESQR
jgi:hypothetical protein